MAKETKKFNPTEWIKEHHVFYVWWKEHRHSGYVQERDGKDYWGIYPWVAYSTERYRAEFSSDTKNKVELRHQPSYEEIETWAKEAQESMENKTSATMNEFRESLRKSIEVISSKAQSPIVPKRRKFVP